jgi:hypothetical protein
MLVRLIANWVYGGFLAGLLLLLLTPVLVHSWPVSLVTTFLCLRFTWSTNTRSTTTIGSDCSSMRRLGSKE